MNTEGFPRKAWKLMPSFKPAEIELVGIVKVFDGDQFSKTSTGTYVAVDKVWDSREEAIAAGWARIAELEADLEKRRIGISKRMAALTKAQKA